MDSVLVKSIKNNSLLPFLVLWAVWIVLDAIGQGVVGILGAPVLVGHDFAVLFART